ncbi:MAG: hypothetical protein IPP72_08150 [Chitinophagaceae bacterium]|nr:hypothetical protein [Chitinophagaceae bacterium]
MKKVILLTTISLCVAAIRFAQDKGFKFSVGPELALPIGDFSNGWSFGIGATAQVEKSLQDKLYGTATGGIVFYNGKSVGGGLKNAGISIIPIRVGAKYFLSGGIYGAMQVGLGFINKGIGTAFAYSPQVGYEFQTKSGKAVDATFKYDGYSKNGTLSEIAFRLAYIF